MTMLVKVHNTDAQRIARVTVYDTNTGDNPPVEAYTKDLQPDEEGAFYIHSSRGFSVEELSEETAPVTAEANG